MESALKGLRETEDKIQSKLDDIFQNFYKKYSFNKEYMENLASFHSFCKEIIVSSSMIHVHTSTLIHYLEHTPHPIYLSLSISADCVKLEKTIYDLVQKNLISNGKSYSDIQIIYIASPKNKALNLVELDNKLHIYDLIWGYYLSDSYTIKVHILL